MFSSIRWPRPSRLAFLLFAVFFAGCIHVADLSRTALRYNEAVEEAQNRMLLLNVVRAEMFRPMYITDLTDFSGSIKLDINSGGVETDFGPYTPTLLKGKGGLTSGKLMPSVDYVQNPTFNVSVLSTQEFMKGFTAPCPMSLLEYYWEEGWPREFLLYLFVHNVDVMAEDGTTTHYENYPDPFDSDLGELERFGEWVTGFIKEHPEFVPGDVSIGSCLKTGPDDLNALVNARKEGFLVVNVKKAWQLEPESHDLFLMSSKDAVDYKGKIKERTCDKPAVEYKKTVLHLRSPEAMLFYLGELMRVEQKFHKIPAVCIGNHLWPLFVAFDRHEELSCKVAVTVSYEGKELIIPQRDLNEKKPGQVVDRAAPEADICKGLGVRPDSVALKELSSAADEPTKKLGPKLIAEEDLTCFSGMSMESFSLLTQLIALQKSAKDTPTTSLVRAIVQ